MSDWEKATRERVRALVAEVGMERILINLTSTVGELGDEPYLIRLRDDLQKTLDNYRSRYEDEAL